MRNIRKQLCKWLTIMALVLSGSSGFPCCAHADDISDKALNLLRKSLEFVGQQDTLLMDFDSDIEVVTPEIEKVQFTSSGKMLLERPGNLYIARTGGYSDIELYLGEKTLTVFGKNLNVYAQTTVPADMNQVIDKIRNELGLDLPGADLFLANAYEDLVADVIDAKLIGEGVINGVECHHLTFRNADTDWQVWIEKSASPFPRKYVITSKNMAAAPQYTLTIKNWQTDVQPAEDVFIFKPPPNAKQVDIKGLAELDEVPPAAAKERGSS